MSRCEKAKIELEFWKFLGVQMPLPRPRHWGKRWRLPRPICPCNLQVTLQKDLSLSIVDMQARNIIQGFWRKNFPGLLMLTETTGWVSKSGKLDSISSFFFQRLAIIIMMFMMYQYHDHDHEVTSDSPRCVIDKQRPNNRQDRDMSEVNKEDFLLAMEVWM